MSIVPEPRRALDREHIVPELKGELDRELNYREYELKMTLNGQTYMPYFTYNLVCKKANFFFLILTVLISDMHRKKLCVILGDAGCCEMGLCYMC